MQLRTRPARSAPPRSTRLRSACWGAWHSSQCSWLSVAGASGALVGALVAGLTRPMLEGDQLALWAVTVGGNLEGYWSAAADEAVRFVIVDGTEVAPSTYTAVLGLHLGALIVALAGVALVAADLRRRPGDRGAQNRRSVVDSIPRSSS